MFVKHLSVILILTAFKQIQAQRNNACPNYRDYFIVDISSNCYHNPDVWQKTPQILRNHVGNFETYNVTTEDGYILTIFRIPPKDSSNPRGSVILQHPVFGNSVAWLQGNGSLGFQMWEQGYDVWLPNNRGTFFSEKHVNLSIHDYEYWDFGFHELGVYDYDAVLSFIKAKTNRSDLIFVGYSLSATASTVYAALRPEKANNTVKLFIEINPVVFLNHLQGPSNLIIPFVPIIEGITRLFHIGAIGAYYSLTGLLFKLLYFLPVKKLFVYLLSFGVGWTPNEFDPEIVNIPLTVLPQATALKIFYHYNQIYNSNGRFPLYNYGTERNIALYQSVTPPEYPLSNIKTPFYIISSSEDYLASTKDVETLYQRLPDEAKIYGNLTVSGFNHIDVIFGKHRQEKIYDKIFDLLSNIGY